ncbi:hypothetical protein B296_00055186, partial [Ensete ventricosum]
MQGEGYGGRRKKEEEEAVEEQKGRRRRGEERRKPLRETVRYWAVPLGRKKKREKNTWSPLRSRAISSPAGGFFSQRGEKKSLPAWGEGTTR